MEFLAENNICGQTILQLTSIGNAIIGEILRLKDYIPEVFRLETKADQLKYGDIIMDFSYFKLVDIETKIETNPKYQELDLEIRESYNDILSRFYLAFESVYQYVTNLNHYINELNEGTYLQYSLESIMQDTEGKQLLCESLFLYGVILMLLDIHIPGLIRERLIVSYYRYNADKSHSDCSIDDVCKLMRSTGYNPSLNSSIVQYQQQNIKNYPENYFNRVQINEQFVEMVTECLQTEDIYNQLQKFPHNRSMALANTASMLYVSLYFQPDILNNQTTKMREICDKFFSNNWVVSIYMGVTVNLIDVWENYRAAKTALANIFQPYLITEVSVNNDKALKKTLEQTKGILKEGTITQMFVMKNLSKLIKLIRECNSCIRWWILHTSKIGSSKKAKQFDDQVINDVKFEIMELYELILNTSQLELRVKEILKELIDERDKKWTDSKKEIDERLTELISCFDGDKILLKIEKNENLKMWLIEIRKEINALDDKAPHLSERKLIQLVQALGEVQEYHNLNQNMHVKQHFDETITNLNMMLYLLTVKDAILIDLQIIGDFSYAWYLIDNFTKIMQDSIKKVPNILIKLRALFLKMATALEVPLLRINQVGGEELVTITRYYSNELVKYIRNIVQIIPHSIFNLLKEIVDIQTNNLKELPTRLDKDKLKEYSQLDERYKIAKMTFTISVFTDGILTMKKTLVGVIELDPKQLLEDGIRKELIKNLSTALNDTLQFQKQGKNSGKELLVVESLNNLAKIIDGYRRSFEYIQDYLNINGLRIWQEETLRLISFNVERECNTFLRRKVQNWQSSYQSDSIPIPIYDPLPNDKSVTFIGRLARELLRITDSKTTIYVDLLTAWFDIKTHQELINLKFTFKIFESIGLYGLVGLDKLYSFMLSNDIEQMYNQLIKKSFKEKQFVEFFQQFKQELKERQMDKKKSPDNPQKFYSNFTTKGIKIWPNILSMVLSIGHKVIWRQHIAYELHVTAKFNSKNLECSLRAFNEAILMELKSHELDESKPEPKPQLISELSKYLETVGLYDPVEKIYIRTQKTTNEVVLFSFLFVISHLNRLVFGKNLLKHNAATNAPATNLPPNVLKQRKQLLDSIVLNKFIDGHVLLLGLVIFLKQFHENNYLMEFVEIYCQYLLEMIEFNLSSKNELSYETQNAVDFLEQFTALAGIPRSVLEEYIPDTILNQCDFLATTGSVS